MIKLVQVAVTGLFTLMATSPVVADSLTAEAVFEQLKALEGTWRGQAQGEGEEAAAEAEAAGEVVHEIRVSAAGTVVMETMGPGTPHEMINMYHLDGDDLVLAHYCAGGNQPQMRLDREESTLDTLVFSFAGGTNLDPSTDPHIHAAKIQQVDDDHIVSGWLSYANGEQAGKMTFHLARSQ